MAAGNVDYSFPKRNPEFSRSYFNFNYTDVGSEVSYLDYPSRTSCIMDDNAYSGRELNVHVLDNECLNYPIALANDNGNSEGSFSLSKGSNCSSNSKELLKMNKNETQPVPQPELMRSVIPEELTVNTELDDDSVHSWRPNLTNSLSSDLFLIPPLADNSPAANVTDTSLSKNEEANALKLFSWDEPLENKLSDDVARVQTSSSPYLGSPNSFHINIQGHIQSQKAQMNIVKYEVMSARRSIAEYKEAIKKLQDKLREKMMFENIQDIQKLGEENAQLRLECQCLCMEVDYYHKGDAPLGEVDEKFYKEEEAQDNKFETQGPSTSQCHAEFINGGTEEQTEAGEWECIKCTFVNHPAIQSCEMCQTSRPKKKQPIFLSSSAICYCHPDKPNIS